MWHGRGRGRGHGRAGCPMHTMRCHVHSVQCAQCIVCGLQSGGETACIMQCAQCAVLLLVGGPLCVVCECVHLLPQPQPSLRSTPPPFAPIRLRCVPHVSHTHTQRPAYQKQGCCGFLVFQRKGSGGGHKCTMVDRIVHNHQQGAVYCLRCAGFACFCVFPWAYTQGTTGMWSWRTLRVGMP